MTTARHALIIETGRVSMAGTTEMLADNPANPQGKIGYIFARDGKLLDPTQTLASNVETSDFQDVEGFLKNGGQRGPQRRILREGTYAINLVQFIVLTDGRVYSLPLSREDMDVIQKMANVIAERNGFFPVIIKDNFNTAGLATTAGALGLRRSCSLQDARLRLRQHGAADDLLAGTDRHLDIGNWVRVHRRLAGVHVLGADLGDLPGREDSAERP